MATSAAIMMATSTATGAYTQSEAAKAQGDFSKAQGDLNAQISDAAARDAITRGDNEAGIQYTKTRQLLGAQRAAEGATGSAIDSGSNLALQDQTQTMGAIDMMTIKNNAVREAYGYKVQAIAQRTQGDIAKIAGDSEAKSTLLVGGMQAASYGAKAFGKPSKPDGVNGPSKAGFMNGSTPTPRINGGGY